MFHISIYAYILVHKTAIENWNNHLGVFKYLPNGKVQTTQIWGPKSQLLRGSYFQKLRWKGTSSKNSDEAPEAIVKCSKKFQKIAATVTGEKKNTFNNGLISNTIICIC